MNIAEKSLSLAQRAASLLDGVPYSIVILPARIATFSVFFRSGLVKIADWNATLQLFREEYKVPVLPPEFAAHMAAAMELGLSSLVLLGLFSRLGVLGLLGMVTVIQLFVEPMGWPDHIQWLAFMVFILWRGPGAFSLDHLLVRRLFHRNAGQRPAAAAANSFG
jgi:putative oxidoreductase